MLQPEIFSVQRAPFTDHGRIECTVGLDSVEACGRGVWKLNVELLEDENIVRKYIGFFDRLKKRSGFW